VERSPVTVQELREHRSVSLLVHRSHAFVHFSLLQIEYPR
jgi:hypothetical protein